ncbi:MAG: GTP cyclohydrolase [Gammaproteobacteria bacterium RIFCSPHIGHO2_12_FULL_35_23]|nr:MAG: GTP cyclohydrolase [Gammaproteobacteria bacterium RIFCSPHIGHO2_12_FULL_35_23]
MFVVIITYTKSLEIVDKYLAEHRAFLDEGYKKNCFVASGPKNPRVGGIIISQLKDKQQLETILSEDPYCIHQVADYKIMEFNPVKFHKDFASFI